MIWVFNKLKFCFNKLSSHFQWEIRNIIPDLPQQCLRHVWLLKDQINMYIDVQCTPAGSLIGIWLKKNIEALTLSNLQVKTTTFSAKTDKDDRLSHMTWYWLSVCSGPYLTAPFAIMHWSTFNTGIVSCIGMKRLTSHHTIQRLTVCVVAKYSFSIWDWNAMWTNHFDFLYTWDWWHFFCSKLLTAANFFTVYMNSRLGPKHRKWAVWH